MSKVRFTDQQLAAIESRGGALLVSAAAGSGKTAVLVERLLRYLEEGETLSRFLMITFTNAAASELRAKIAAAITKRLAASPTDRHLTQELARIHNANIQTVHGFCASLLRNHGHSLGIAGDFRILDEQEGDVMRRLLLDDLMEEAYAAKDPDFLAMVSALSGARSDNPVAEAVLTFWEKSRSHPDPAAWRTAQREFPESDDCFITPWGALLREQMRETVAHGYAQLGNACLLMRTNDLRDAYLEIFNQDLAMLSEFSDALDGTWDEACAAAEQVMFVPRLKPIRNPEDPRSKELITTIRKDVKSDVEAVVEKLRSASNATVFSDLATTRPVVHGLIDLADALDAAFSREKLRRNCLDYGDLEQFSIKLLVERIDGDQVLPTPLARSVSEGFCEIMVDEYQDTNAVQDLIFRAVSKDEKNLVMVGDIKQSIYRFRLADPTIFLQKYKTFRPVAEAAPGEPRRVVLNRNFRSRPEVLDAANHYFKRLMSESLGDLDYTDEEALYPGRDFPAVPQGPKTEAVILNIDPEMDAREQEAAYLAARIGEMINQQYRITDGAETRPIRYGDIVILLRSQRGKAHTYVHALENAGIPCVSEKSANLLGSVEVGVIISLLSVIDNPLQDVPLAGVLRSPLFGFTADELAALRLTCPDGCYFDALSHVHTEKVHAFLQVLSCLRDRARECSVSRLIWESYRLTHAFGLIGALPQGQRRVQNLILFYQYAQRFPHGLCAFLRHLTILAADGKDIDGYSEESENAVHIMTIHKSKGLEFPVVFLADCSRRFNRMDLSESVLIHPRLGLGLRARDEALAAEWPTLQRLAISRALDRENKSEELRLLYVAMTRAQEKLILTCALPNAPTRMDRIDALCAYDPERKRLSPSVLADCNSLDPWIILPLLPPPDAVRVTMLDPAALPASSFAVTERLAETAPEIDFAARFSFVYPYKAAVDLSSKATATGTSAHTPSFDFSLPTESLTAAARGSAAHRVLQCIDLARTTTEAEVAEEINRLCAAGYLTEEEAVAIPPSMIASFFSSKLGTRIRFATHCARERRFSVLLPAPELPSERVLLQGVIDLYFEDENGLVLVDFKTDHSMARVPQYTSQLESYARALVELTGKPVRERYLYFLELGKCLPV